MSTLTVNRAVSFFGREMAMRSGRELFGYRGKERTDSERFCQIIRHCTGEM